MILSDLYLFARALFKASLTTGILPGIFIFYAAHLVARVYRVPAGNQGERWVDYVVVSSSDWESRRARSRKRRRGAHEQVA